MDMFVALPALSLLMAFIIAIVALIVISVINRDLRKGFTAMVDTLTIAPQAGETLEVYYDKAPEATRKLIRFLLGVSDNIADFTPSTDDDRLVRFLQAHTVGTEEGVEEKSTAEAEVELEYVNEGDGGVF